MRRKVSRPEQARSAGVFITLLACLISAGEAATPASSTRGVWNIVYLGDSITEGAHLGRNTPPDVCTAELRKRLVNAEIYMANDGHSGHTTVDFLPSSDTDFTRAEQDATSLQKKHPGRLVFSIMLGTNDSAQYGPNGAPVSPATYEQNLREIIGKLVTDFPSSLVVIQQPTWYSPNTANASEYGEDGLHRLQSYFPLIPEIASRFPGKVFLGDTRAYNLIQKQYRLLLTPENGRHGVFYLHPNPAGAKLLGTAWAAAIFSRLQHTPPIKD